MKKLAIALAVVLSLSACGARSVAELHDAPSARSEFIVQASYQEVYRTLLDATRSCYNGFGGMARFWTEGQVYSDLGKAEIVAMRQMILSPEILLHIEISRTDAGTKVVAASDMMGGGHVPRVQEWAQRRNFCTL